MNRTLILLLAIATFCGTAPRLAAETPELGKLAFFEKKIRPLLVENCYSCHSANTNSKGGLRVDDRNGLINGGGRGAAIVPGEPDKSLLLNAVLKQGKVKMPPNKDLSEEQVADLRQWILDGATWPGEEVPKDLGKLTEEDQRLRREHWAWQKLQKTDLPQISNEKWPKLDLDRFVLAKLDEQKLAPNGDATKRDLIRRLTFDLTGLPPTVDEVNSFINDSADDATEKLVDRLLASPAFGERWGRHWLDVARYGESTGSARNLPYPQAWRYRDYVIAAINKNKPYDQLIREQIAGDLLEHKDDAEREEHLIATGFLALGVKDVNQRFKVRYVMDNIDDQIDTVSRAFLGLTVSCARCHDHKFDPIPTTDYYALAGIFHSTDLCSGLRNKMGGGGLDYYDTQMLITLGTKTKEEPDAEQLAKIEKAKAAVEAAREEFEKLRDDPESLKPGPNGRPIRQVARQKMNRLQAELLALSDPSTLGEVALGVRDAKTIADTEVRLRGEAERLGPKVPRGFLGIVEFDHQLSIPTDKSGRLELAQWLTHKDNPLTQRVIVNRVWQHLFGEGLVSSVDNFGVTGDKPTHPELLDYLAQEFVREGWSLKKFIRTVVLSRTYQLSSAGNAENTEIDPANRYLWRHSIRRLDAEEIRDATLAQAGKLSPGKPEKVAVSDFKVIELRNNGPEARKLEEQTEAHTHRSVYLPLLRTLTPHSLAVFDFAEQGMVTGRRDQTTVAPQSLYQLNSSFVRQQAVNFAQKLLSEKQADDSARIARAYEIAFGRPASSQEVERVAQYLDAYRAEKIAAEKSETPTKAKRKGKGPQPDAVAVKDESESSTASSEEPAKAPEATKTTEASQAKAAAVLVNADEADQTDAPIVEKIVEPNDPQVAAWASFCQALLSSAEFQYLK
jgi:cytochrome c553